MKEANLRTADSAPLRLGLDIGSTTLKTVILDGDGLVVGTDYRRHHANVTDALHNSLESMGMLVSGRTLHVAVTGSVGMGLAERLGLDFVQEVVAATTYVQAFHPQTRCLIDIGGEDAKIVCLNEKGVTDFRMNGNCAGGTGAFIDQMAVLLGITTPELDNLASQATRTYDIASRCGVFSKTDIQNLVGLGAAREDIAASVFHAVAVQTIVTLSHGCRLKPPVLLCGGPLTFIPSLRKAFAQCLHLNEADFILPVHSELIPAYGTALSARSGTSVTADELIEKAEKAERNAANVPSALPPLFINKDIHAAWAKERTRPTAHRDTMPQEIFLGIDSGSTTTKIVATDTQGRLAFSYYCNNQGSPIEAVKEGLLRLSEAAKGTPVTIKGSCATGYGEDLIRAAFDLDGGTIETIAHFMAAKRIEPEVSFVLDIGGQDMKAIFVAHGAVTRMELNEACSSGCGSFIETFAKTLGHSVEEFAQMACTAKQPADLGTRCTVFMNSKVKQVMREGSKVDDIAAGLAYSVAKNCLYKVLKLPNADALGKHIVVQGGTMKNDAVVRAFEKLTEAEVVRSDCPELMGAYGCALYAAQMSHRRDVPLAALTAAPEHEVRTRQCHGCENRCTVQQYDFGKGRRFFSGNKCERHFSNHGNAVKPGFNVYTEKYKLLFDRPTTVTKEPKKRIGIPRCLNMYEEYPFWHALLTTAGFYPVLSAPATMKSYEKSAHAVMSDNICFPAKLVHAHITDLLTRGVDRIFMPYVVFEKQGETSAQNSYNCPIVSGYSDVIRSVTDTQTPIDSPTISFKEKQGLWKECRDYLQMIGTDRKTARIAFEAACTAQEKYERDIYELNQRAWQTHQGLAVVLAGRPYHTDPLIQHKIADSIAALGVDVLSDDIVRYENNGLRPQTHLVRQWAYVNRIVKAATWVAEQDTHVQLVQITSFGCGPDAFLTDEVRDILGRVGKPHTLLKVDDVSHIGSLKLRIRSLIESLRLKQPQAAAPELRLPFRDTPPFYSQDRRRKILIPHFTPFISPLIPDLLATIGYDAETLPPSDEASAEAGLCHANNEVCYPATLIVGDLIKALKSGRYDPQQTAVAISLTCGQCRATNYVALIKKALVEAGFGDIPLVTVGFENVDINPQPGFRVPWLKILPLALASILLTDCLAKFYYATLARETETGTAQRLLTHYTEEARTAIQRKSTDALYRLIGEAATAFDKAATTERHLPQVGIVGEIFLKFNRFAHRRVVDYLATHGVEIRPPQLLGFFMQGFVNRRTCRATHLQPGGGLPDVWGNLAYRLVNRYVRRANKEAARFRHFTPFADIFSEAESVKGIVSLSAQFGEGWGLPAEVSTFAREGVTNILCLQPFGCIANHVVAKGITKSLKARIPGLNILILDFDGGVSEVNVRNRLLLFMNHLNKDTNDERNRPY